MSFHAPIVVVSEDESPPLLRALADAQFFPVVGTSFAEAADAILPFRQPKRPPDGGYAGTGLGLPIAKALVALHGGTLKIASAPDKGTEVTISLPVKCAS